ncbi:peroxiredoxin [Nonlabens dokdonensis]|uniref:Peroxiredoxin n=2 Tax=Nonlabens dokdonensis TaxID=328515 RepID=A0ABX5PWW4_9FLAO|nr:TlpA disulfide reductase family protein [Nonlabens dokdonensis]AGC78574.1 putative lipoprotein/thioredoxin [Nonlabens dokdonensis DSW-6]PZX39295.1 peroxiredoxin [Nonlabens dokdonensis]
MKKLLLGIIVLLLISCNENPAHEFSLNGKTKGLKNGTVLYLDVENKTIDSTQIENNTFKFNTVISESPLQVVLRTKDFSQYRFLWIENKPMTFDALNTDFKYAVVTGSKEEELVQKLRDETKELTRPERLNKNIQFIEDNPNSIHSAYILSVYATTWGKEKTKELFDHFSPENKSTEYGEGIATFIELNKNPDIGEKYVDFEMNDITGKSRRLSEFEGKLVLLEFWSSSCGPCRKENPNLVQTYEEYQDKGFEVFAVSEDTDKTRWQKAIEEDKLPWTQVSDLNRKNKASMIYGINAIPDNFLIDKNGVIIDRNLRGEELNKKLKELLN